MRGKLGLPSGTSISERSIPACAGEAAGPESCLMPEPVYPRVCGGSGESHQMAGHHRGLSPRVRGKPAQAGLSVHWARSIPACAGEAALEYRAGTSGPVYPRVCGGSNAKYGGKGNQPGLSPRVRGKRHTRRHHRQVPGSIPACAGEARPGEPRVAGGKVYPRVCGGNQRAANDRPGRIGLSPRVRGKLPRPPRHRPDCGSIPACAGETATAARIQRQAEVYPRVCGGNTAVVELLAAILGLSPRVRGKPVGRAYQRQRQRSIPACAGETHANGVRFTQAGVYPRVCGGNIHPKTGNSIASGLSPRVRGKHTRNGSAPNAAGSIPACAGETLHHPNLDQEWWVYPRVCGGNDMRARYYLAQNGLSPRVRGKRRRPYASGRRPRSIPACAGETCVPGGSAYCRRVYPRVCGGNWMPCRQSFTIPGLSPRVRGKLCRVVERRLERRSIPACAGETRTPPRA